MDVMVPDLVNEKNAVKSVGIMALPPSLSPSHIGWRLRKSPPSLAGCITKNLVHYNIERTRQVVCFGLNSC